MLTSHRISTAAALALAAAAFSLGSVMPAAAQTPCAQWEIHGRWTAIQGNHRVDFHVNQHGTKVYGIGAPYKLHSAFESWGAFGARTEYPVTGTVRGNAVEIRTAWGGVYLGTIDATGRIDGYTYDLRDSTSNANWFSNRRMTCAVEASPPAPAPAAAPPASPPSPAPIVQGSNTVFGSRNSGVGSVFRSGGAQIPAPVPTPAFIERPSGCKPGFVPRFARAADLVCVTTKSRDRVARENATARERVQPGVGAYGPNTCKSGYVWREAFAGDGVCVKPDIRALVQRENQLAAARRK
jgi:hypothetical protein